MSLETLLEAAKYLEYRSQVKARGEEPHDYYTFSKLSSVSNDVTVSQAQPSHSHQKHPQPSSTNSSNTTEETKERKRTCSSTSRDSLLSQEHSGSGTREVHNKLEKNRRAHLKECFEALKKQLPNMDERKTSNLSILRGAIRYIQNLKRKEREHEHDLEKLARDKIAFQQQLAALKKELAAHFDHIDVNALMAVEDNETTTTASECGAASDFEDDFHHEVSSTSNHNSRLASDDTSSLSSSNAVGTINRSITTTTSSTQALAFPKQISASTVFPSSLKGTVLKNNSHFTSDTLACGAAKVLSRSTALESHNLFPATTTDDSGSHSSRVISTSSLQAMTGILTAPHAVQVITPPSSIKLLTAPNTVSPSSSVQALPVSHCQHGQIHVLAPSSVSYVSPPPITASNAKAVVSEPVVQVADPVHCKQQSVSPVALVSSQAFVGITQAVTNSKPVVIKQTSSFSELMASGATSSLAATQLMMKSALSSSVFGSNMALTVKNSLQPNNIAEISSSSAQSVLNPTLHVAKTSQQLIQPSSAAQNVNNLIPTEGVQVGNIRQVAASKPHSISTSTCNLLTHASNMAQLVSQSPITVPASQIVAPGSHVTGVTPLVGSVSVVSHTGALHHHQILAQSQSLGKVLASPILKSINQVNQIPIIQQQFIQATSSNQHIVKPVVVVSMPNIIHPSSISPLTQRPLVSSEDHCENICSPAPSIQK